MGFAIGALAFVAFGQARFPAQAWESGGEFPGSIHVADVDGDGALDVLVGFNGHVQRLSGDGGGGLSDGERVNEADWRVLHELVDLDGDGRLDMVGSRRDFEPFFPGWPVIPGAVRVAYGAAAGTWLPGVDLESGDFTWIGAADFNADGRLDLIAWEQTVREFRVLLAQAMGFAPARAFAPGVGITGSPAIADFDADGALDVAFLAPDWNDFPQRTAIRRVIVWTGDGLGGLASRIAIAAPHADQLTAADVDGDGFEELISHSFATSNTGATIHRRFAGAFVSSYLQHSWRAPASYVDFDFDGDLDVLSFANQGAEVRRNDGAGGFGASKRIWGATTAAVGALADLDGDGWLDAILVTIDGDVVVNWATAQGVWNAPASTVLPRAEQRVLSGDLNNDSRADLVSVRWDRVETFLGDGAGGFVEHAEVSPSQVYFETELADFDGDGALDLLGTYFASQSMAAVHLNDGTGRFAPIAITTALGPQGWRVGDFDGDGRADLIRGGGTLDVRRGDGSGGFRPPVSTALAAPSHVLETADFDADGIDDVVLSTVSTSLAYVMLGSPSAVFTGPASTLSPSDSLVMATGDFDGDGRVDIAAWDCVAGAVRIGSGDGAGSFSNFTSTPFASSTLIGNPTLAASDFDEDGLDDIAVFHGTASGWGPKLSVLHSRGPLGLARPTHVAMPVLSSMPTFLDADSDGKTELLVRDDWTLRPVLLGEE